MTQNDDSDQQESASRYEIDPEEQPSEAVIHAVATAGNQSPLEMEPLSEAIDLDALDTLLRTADKNASPPTVTFEYCQRQVSATPTAIRIEGSVGSSFGC